jgi:hypothetical protein
MDEVVGKVENEEVVEKVENEEVGKVVVEEVVVAAPPQKLNRKSMMAAMMLTLKLKLKLVRCLLGIFRRLSLASGKDGANLSPSTNYEITITIII